MLNNLASRLGGESFGGWYPSLAGALGGNLTRQQIYDSQLTGMQNAYQGVPEEVLTPSGAENKRQDAKAKRLASKLEIIRLVSEIEKEMLEQLDNFEAVKADGKPHIMKRSGGIYLKYTGRCDSNDGSYQWAHNFLEDVQDFLHAYANKDAGENNDIARELRLAKSVAGVN